MLSAQKSAVIGFPVCPVPSAKKAFESWRTAAESVSMGKHFKEADRRNRCMMTRDGIRLVPEGARRVAELLVLMQAGVVRRWPGNRGRHREARK